MGGCSDAVRFIEEQDQLLLVSHISPDGDTLGSALALYAALKAMKKNVQLACCEPVPPKYAFLPLADELRSPEEIEPFTAVVYIDCADIGRAGALAEQSKSAAHSFCIDHHESNKGFAEENWISFRAATGELIFELLLSLPVVITPNMALCLYTALATDTGNFAYSNTSPQTLITAARLLAFGFDMPELNRRLFRSMSLPHAKMIGEALGKVHLLAGGSVAVACLSAETMRRFDATAADCEGVIDYLRDIEGVEVACLLRDSKAGVIRVSLRSKRYCNVGKIAQSLGGGGHERAAGCNQPPPLESAYTTVCEHILAALEA